MALDPSEMDRIATLTKVALARLVDWKNAGGTPFELRASNFSSGACTIDLNTPERLQLTNAVLVMHGEFEQEKTDDGTTVYRSKQGNTMGQATTNDGRPAYGVGYDLTEIDADGRPILKVYFGTASAWFVKNVYHQKWNDLREVRRELEPDSAPAPPEDTRVGKERAQNPRSRQRQQEREQRQDRAPRRGRRGGRGRSGGGGGSRGGD